MFRQSLEVDIYDMSSTKRQTGGSRLGGDIPQHGLKKMSLPTTEDAIAEDPKPA